MPKSIPAAPANALVGTWRLLTLTQRHWREDHCSLLAAGLAFYTLISLVPLLVLTLAVAGMMLGEQASLGRIAPGWGQFLGPEVAGAVQGLMESVAQDGLGHATVVSAAVLLWTASIVFAHLRRALNIVWDAKPRGGMGGEIVSRLMTFGMVAAVGALFGLFAILNAALGLVRNYLTAVAPQLVDLLPLWEYANLVIFFTLQAVLWALVYKLLPALKLSWRDVRAGAVVTAGLTTAGMYALRLYFRHMPGGSFFGAAASVMVVLVWIYIASQVFLVGAEFTWAWAHLFGSRSGRALGGARSGDPGAGGAAL